MAILLSFPMSFAFPGCEKAKVSATLVSGGTPEFAVETTFNSDDIILNRSSMDATRQLVVFTPTENIRSVEYLAVKSDVTCDDSLSYLTDPPLASGTYLTSDGTWKVCISIVTTSGEKNIIASNNFIVDFTAPTLGFTSTSNGTSHTPTIQGTTTEPSIVTLYSDADCSTQISSAASSSVFESPGITMTTLMAGVATDIYAMGIDLAGNPSSCSKITTITPSNSSPVVSSLSPTSGILAGGTAITITGTGFLSGAAVSIGGSACTSVSVSSAISITCTTPSHAAGAVTVSVTNTDTQSGSLASGFTYQAAPVVSSLSPTSGILAGGTAITITGTGFLSGAAVSIGGSGCTSVSVSSATSITCTTPSHAAGAVTVSVTNTDTQSGSLVSGFTYTAPPVVSSLSPTSGILAGGTAITITGTGFLSGAVVSIGGSGCTSVSVSSATSITCTTPSHTAGAVTVSVTNTDTQSGSLVSGFTYTPEKWTATVTGTLDTPPGRYQHSAVWTGSKMIVWGGTDAALVYLNSGGIYDPVANSWTPTSEISAPPVRSIHTAVWTGSKMIVWGGHNGSTAVNSGGRYDPVTNQWLATSTASDPDPQKNPPDARYFHVAVWTGSKMIVWGGIGAGYLNTGGRYDPDGDAWTSTSVGANVPAGRYAPTAIWTGSKMVVWGGSISSDYYNTGGRYDPVDDFWASTATTIAPLKRAYATAVWTGSKMIVWGGFSSSGSRWLNSGGVYDPVDDLWAVTSTGSAPSGRSYHTAVWTGSKMIVWGGDSNGWFNNDGALYDPVANSWAAMTATNSPSGRTKQTAVWTGSNMILWGGLRYEGENATALDSGGIYTPPASSTTNSWTDTIAINTPLSRWGQSTVWTGSKMIVWAGYRGGAGYLNDGGQYDPVANSWSSILASIANTPSARTLGAVIWTGSMMIVWGGYGADGNDIQDGGQYDPVANTWSSIANSLANSPAKRRNHTAVWTGSKMIVWGGYDLDGITGSTYYGDGGRYDPRTNTWDTIPLSLTDAPSGRHYHTAVWTGSQMIVWGGQNGGSSFGLGNGGRYDPVTNTWDPVPISLTGAPSGTAWHTAIWTGSKMIVWGGSFGGSSGVSGGGLYDPFINTWSAVSSAGAPAARYVHTAVWTGSKMIVWGGTPDGGAQLSDGGQYDPVADSWSEIMATNSPTARFQHRAVWTGSKMILWGGYDGAALSSGGVYDP